MAGPYSKFRCTYCQEDISGLHIKCVVCEDFELCLQCFSSGAEIGAHKNDHAYQFMDSGAVGWTAREELYLLDAVEAYSFGNWEDISRHIETKSPEEVRDHYTNKYLEGAIGRLTLSPAISHRPNLPHAANFDTGPLSPTSCSRLPPLDVAQADAKELAYMPLRGDFDLEFDNDAESVLSPLSVNEADDALDTALTLAQVDVYTNRLRERARRKRVARDFQLVSNFFNSARREKLLLRRKSCNNEKEYQDNLRGFCQFHTAQEHEQFIHNLNREQELTFRLSELLRYRSNGITRHEECAHFEKESFFKQEFEKDAIGMDSSGPTRHPLRPTCSSFRKRGKRGRRASCSIGGRSASNHSRNLHRNNRRFSGVAINNRLDRSNLCTLPNGSHVLSLPQNFRQTTLSFSNGIKILIKKH